MGGQRQRSRRAAQDRDNLGFLAAFAAGPSGRARFNQAEESDCLVPTICSASAPCVLVLVEASASDLRIKRTQAENNDQIGLGCELIKRERLAASGLAATL